MVRSSLDINRKLKKYQQHIKVLKRGIQVKRIVPNSKQPDFSLGTYSVKPSTKYTLLLNTSEADLSVEVWGIGKENVHRINKYRIRSSSRDVRLEFSTYPHTSVIFFSISSYDPDNRYQVGGYSLNYIFIEGKYAIPKGSSGKSIPGKIELDYNFECHPDKISTIDLNFVSEVVKGLCPINMNIFEHNLIGFLLRGVNDADFLSVLKFNLIKCNIPPENYYNNTQIEISNLKQTIANIGKGYEILEERMELLEKMGARKNNLEDNIGGTEDQNIEIEKKRNMVELLNKFNQGLNLKINYVSKLRMSNQESNLSDSEKNNIGQVLNYYLKRIKTDKTYIKDQIESVSRILDDYQDEIILPGERKVLDNQSKLDGVITEYRDIKDEVLEIKGKLDYEIIKFMIEFRDYIYGISV